MLYKFNICKTWPQRIGSQEFRTFNARNPSRSCFFAVWQPKHGLKNALCFVNFMGISPIACVFALPWLCVAVRPSVDEAWSSVKSAILSAISQIAKLKKPQVYGIGIGPKLGTGRTWL